MLQTVLHFVKCLLCIKGFVHIIFLIYPIKMVYYIDRFKNIKLSLHPWNNHNWSNWEGV